MKTSGFSPGLVSIYSLQFRNQSTSSDLFLSFTRVHDGRRPGATRRPWTRLKIGPRAATAVSSRPWGKGSGSRLGGLVPGRQEVLSFLLPRTLSKPESKQSRDCMKKINTMPSFSEVETGCAEGSQCLCLAKAKDTNRLSPLLQTLFGEDLAKARLCLSFHLNGRRPGLQVV